jgi:hypothetical protein
MNAGTRPGFVLRRSRLRHHWAAALAAGLSWPCGHAASAEPPPIQSYYYFVHWMSVNRPDLALQQFTADAVVVAGPNCTRLAPCVGRASIRTGYLDALGHGRAALPLYEQQFDGQRLRTRDKQVVRHGRLQRNSYVVRFRAGQIESLMLESAANGLASHAEAP